MNREQLEKDIAEVAYTFCFDRYSPTTETGIGELTAIAMEVYEQGLRTGAEKKVLELPNEEHIALSAAQTKLAVDSTIAKVLEIIDGVKYHKPRARMGIDADASYKNGYVHGHAQALADVKTAIEREFKEEK